MANTSWWKWTYLGDQGRLERTNNGRNRRTSKKGQGSAVDEPNSCAGGAGSQNSYQGTLQNSLSHTHSGASQRTRIEELMLRQQQMQYMQYVVWSADPLFAGTGTCPRTGKWCPPYMAGELGVPNRAKQWIPHQIGDIQSEGVQAGEIVAWRAWYWDAKRKRLRSIFVDYEWPINGDPAVGEPGRGYGIHAFKTQGQVISEYRQCLQDLFIGKVALWGDVIEYEGGYCAEFAKPYHIVKMYSNIPEAMRSLYSLDENGKRIG